VVKTISVDELLDVVARLRGRKKARMLSDYDIVCLLCSALESKSFSSACGDSVANAYSYPACRMRAAAVYDGKMHSVWIACDIGDARRGSSGVPGGGQAKALRRRVAGATGDDMARMGYRAIDIESIFTWRTALRVPTS
jgi:hypothetical protein